MAKKIVSIKLTFEYDPAENFDIPVRIFLFQMINRLNYDWPVKEIEYKGRLKTFTNQIDVRELALKNKDGVEGVTL